MNAQGVRRCVEEKEMYATKYGDLLNHCHKLEEECSLYERDLERIMESCDELGKENEELRLRLQGASNVSVESYRVIYLLQGKIPQITRCIIFICTTIQ